MNTDAVRAYYASIGEREWTRLENPDDGAIEYEVIPIQCDEAA